MIGFDAFLKNLLYLVLSQKILRSLDFNFPSDNSALV